jgi:hypothetical protein
VGTVGKQMRKERGRRRIEMESLEKSVFLVTIGEQEVEVKLKAKFDVFFC